MIEGKRPPAQPLADRKMQVSYGYSQNGRPHNKNVGGVRLLVALPALNEESTIVDVLDTIPREIESVDTVEILVVDDGSRDQTGKLAADRGARVIRHQRAYGVGTAFQSALEYALEREFDFLVTIDADGQFDARRIPDLIAPVVNDTVDFTTASRFIDPALTPEMPWFKYWGNRQMSRLISRLTRHEFFDVSCGMRCYNRRAMLNLNLMGAYTYTQEVFLNLAFKRLRIMEIPMKVKGTREFGKSRVVSSVWSYGFRALRIILAAYRDYNPIRFFGGMALLLMVPASLLALFLLVYYLNAQKLSPHKWAGFTAALLSLFSLLLVHVGVIGDMLNRHRVYLEEILFYNRLGGKFKDTPLHTPQFSRIGDALDVDENERQQQPVHESHPEFQKDSNSDGTTQRG